MTNNKLIAEFMGVHNEISLDSIAGNIHSWSDAPFFYITEDSKEKVMEGIAKYSKYDTSWDWLMPVVKKCLVGEAEQSEEISNTTIKNIYEGICNQDISQAYKSVVEFIKTYNKIA